MNIKSGVKLYQRPRLKEPYLIAAWPGMGNVALKTARYLQEKLNAQKVEEIEPADFFQLGGILIKDAAIEPAEPPRSRFYYRKDENLRNDLLIFIGEAQPVAGKEYEFGNRILEVAEGFKVKRIYTFAAMPTSMDYKKRPEVWAATTSREMVEDLKGYDLRILNEGTISGMNGLLLGFAKARGIEGICLLGEIPYYTIQIENPRSSQAVLERLTEMLGIHIDLTELEQLAEFNEREIMKYIHQIKEQIREEQEVKKEDKGPEYLH